MSNTTNNNNVIIISSIVLLFDLLMACIDYGHTEWEK